MPARSSGTARLIAAATILAFGDAELRDLVPVPAVHWCRRLLLESSEGLRLLASIRSRIGRAGWWGLERLVARGVVRHWLLRKRRIEGLARAAAADGFTQLVVLGAGLDTLAMRLAQVRVFERVIAVDHPASLDQLHAAMGSDGSGVKLTAADLGAGGLREALNTELESGRPTLFIAEGLLMYLTRDQVVALLRELADGPVKARLIGTYMDTVPGQRIGFRRQSALVQAWLKRRGEPMRWSITEDALPGFLAATGWQLTHSIRARDLSQEHDPRARPFRGENLFMAERAQDPTASAQRPSMPSAR